jgi:hypothetical protein
VEKMVEGNFEGVPKGKIHSVNYIQEYPHHTQQIQGITNHQCQDLLAQCEMQHRKLQGDIVSKKIGINQKGAGGKGKLEIKEQVCLCLFYLRKMPTFEVLGLHFGISSFKFRYIPEVKDIFHYWLEILPDVFPPPLLEQVEKHDSDYAMATQNERQETKSFPLRVLLLNRSSLDL